MNSAADRTTVGGVGPRPVPLFLTAATLLVLLALVLAAAHLPTFVYPALGLLGVWLIGVLVLFSPQLPLLGLLVLYPFYIPLSFLVLSRLPGILELAVSGGKDALLALLVVATFGLGRGRLRRVAGRVWFILSAFAALLIAQAVIAPTPLRPSLLSVRFHLTYLFMLPVAAVVLRGTHLAEQFQRVILISGAVLAVAWLSVIGWTGLSDLGFQYATIRVLASAGDMGDPINVFATYLAVILCLTLGGAGLASSRWKWLLYGAALLVGWALLTTFSRRAIVGAGLGVFTMAVVSGRIRLVVPIAAAGVVVLAYASRDFLLRFTRINYSGGATTRMEHIRYTLENLDPLTIFVGHGVGTAGHVAQAAGVETAVPIHNYYFLLLFESGGIGLLLYLALCGVSFQLLYRAYRREELGWKTRGLVIGTIGALAAFLFAGLFGVGNAVLPGAPVVWASCGVGIALAGHDPQENRETRRVAP